MANLPLILEPSVLQSQLDDVSLLIVDLCKNEHYQRHHVPGAVHLSPSQLVSGVQPAMGKLPTEQQLSEIFSIIGLTPDKHVVVYDDEGGGWAGRLIWTLDVIGHCHYSYLNGGLHAWLKEGHPTTAKTDVNQSSQYHVTIHHDPIADMPHILAHLDDPNTVIWDARSPEEYRGERLCAQRGGHIPGAINYEWTNAMDQQNNLRLRSLECIAAELSQLGVTSDKEIITHCQTHHRSGFTYLLAKALQFPNVKAYPGSWSEWGNQPDTPVES